MLLLGFIGLAVVIYFLTYIPDMLAGDSFSILNLQNAMAGFMSGTVKDSSSTPWWSWPFMIGGPNLQVPQWFDITYLPNNVVSTITTMGNPAVWWVGFVCVLTLAGIVLYETRVGSKVWEAVIWTKIGDAK